MNPTTTVGEKQKGQAKTARNPIKIVPVTALKKPDWIRVWLTDSPRLEKNSSSKTSVKLLDYPQILRYSRNSYTRD